MDYKEHIAKAVEYIEENLTNEIDLAACAKACGYSKYYFLRAFKEVAGITPIDYIRKRRLSEIAKRICEGDEYISEIAFAYGFNSKENFTRAFKDEYHILPTEYKQVQNSLIDNR
jgi:AraC family transcriptional regulator